MRIYLAIAIATLPILSFAEVSQPISGQLDNGLRYTILPLHEQKNRLDIRMRVYAGAVDEQDQQAGVAHMLEHLVFRATDKHPNIMNYLHAQQWQRARHYNAVTTDMHTTYMFNPPAQFSLAQSLDVLQQMLFHAQLTDEDLNKERKIILEEWRGGQGVGSRMNEQRKAVIRADSRYTRHPVIGTQTSINTMPAKELQQFYHTWYVPNNMHLVITGDVDPTQAKAIIQQTFGTIPSKTLPTRDYYDPKLSHTLRINHLQDDQSGVSQVAYIFRINEQAQQGESLNARRERTIDRLALSVLTERLRNQTQFTKGVNSVVVRKQDIGKQTSALGIFASVDATSQAQGLQQIFTEIERIQRYPIQAAELQVFIDALQQQIQTAKQHQNDRPFEAWVQLMQTTALENKPYQTQAQIATKIEAVLKTIQLTDIQQRIQQWLNSPDQIIQYQAPHNTKIKPITQVQIRQWQQQSKQQNIAPPQAKKVITAMQLDATQYPQNHTNGRITQEKSYPIDQHAKVYQWTLSNGDRVVWLKSPIAKQKTYFQAINNAGFKHPQLINWQSQVASQLINANAPLHWQKEQLDLWKKNNKINLSNKQTAYTLIFEGNSEQNKSGDLFLLYQQLQKQTQFKEQIQSTQDSLNKILEQQTNPKNNLAVQRSNAITQLRFQHREPDGLPTAQQLQQFDVQDLQQQWATMSNMPTTYYILSDLKPHQMQTLIKRYLATIPRQTALSNQQLQPTNLATTGVKTIRFAYNPEPKDDIQLWTFSPHQWQGADALLVASLRQIASNKLKQTLRDEQLAIYSLSFDTKLNPENHRIESELKFTSAPQNSTALIQSAQEILLNLAESINEDDVKSIKSNFIQQEKQRLTTPETWLNRLILSDQFDQTPRYLNQMQALEQSITLENLKRLAKEIYNPNNVKILITTPLKTETPNHK